MLAIIKILWAAPYTLLGLLIAFSFYALAGFRGDWQWRAPAFSFHNVLTQRLFASPWFRLHALCIGQVILARNAQCLADSWSHECEHVRQTLRYGLIFPVLYCGHSFWCILTGRRAYWDNLFEQQARAAAEPVRHNT